MIHMKLLRRPEAGNAKIAKVVTTAKISVMKLGFSVLPNEPFWLLVVVLELEFFVLSAADGDAAFDEVEALVKIAASGEFAGRPRSSMFFTSHNQISHSEYI